MTDAPPIRRTPHDSALGCWESVARRPHSSAGHFSLGYLGLRGEMQVRRELHLPSGFPAIVVNFGSPFQVSDPTAPETSVICGEISFMGVHSRPFVTETPVERDLLVVNLTPVGARRVLGAPMDELANRWVPVSDILGDRAPELSGQLRAADSWAARFTVFDRFLLERFDAARAPKRDLGPAWRWMSGGDAVGSLARRLDVSHKHLIDLFRDQVGLPPKLVGRLARFNRVLRLPVREGQGGWAEAALACGYFDQAHMINEFHDFAGAPPGALVKRRAAFTLRA